MIYDVNLNAEPLSLTTLARSYPALPFRGLVSGPIRAKGTSPDLELVTSLEGSGGALTFDGRLDIDSIGGYAARGRGQFTGLSLAQLLEKTTIPAGPLSGRYDVDLLGATAADLRGKADLDIERTTFDSLRVFPSHATVRFADGRMVVDSLRLRTSAGTTVVSGAIGLPKGQSDSGLTIVMTVDSLGGLRKYVGGFVVLPSGESIPDSLNGRIRLTATARGRLDSLDVRGTLNASELLWRGAQGLSLTGTFDVKNVLTAPSGTVVFHADSLQVAGVALDTLGGTVNVIDKTRATFVAAAARANGPAARALGEVTTVPGGQSVRLDSLRIAVGEATWQLASPARFTVDSVGMSLDSMLVRNADSAFIALGGMIPNQGAVTARAQGGRIPIKDFAELAKYSSPVTGLAEFAVRLSGTKAQPDITATANVADVKVGALTLDRVTSSGGYRNGRLTGDLDLFLKGKNTLRASAMVPLNLTLFKANVPNDPVHVELVADSADLSIVELFFPRTVDKPSGRLALNVVMDGRWGPRDSLLTTLSPTGYLRIENGRIGLMKPLGITLANVHADVQLLKNVLTVTDVSATSLRGRANNSVKLSGSITNPYSPALRSYDLTLNAASFRAMDKRTRASLDVSTGLPGLRLAGSGSAVSLTGNVLVDHSNIFLPDPEVARKQLMDLDSDTLSGGMFGAGKSSVVLNKLGLRSVAVNVSLGDDVKLKSNEADVRLAGTLTVGMQRTFGSRLRTDGRDEPQYVPTVDGQLLARGGTYTLNLGPVRRDFSVTDGRVTFDGSPIPDVDISALYNVKRYRQQDIGIIVHVKGPLLPGPVIEFSSDQPYEIPQSDLVSYLVTGEPGFDALAGNQAALQSVATLLAPTASSLLTSGLRQSLGSWVDIVQFQGAAADRSASGINATTLGDFFAGGSLSAGTQVGPNLFFSLSAGLCQFDLRSGNQGQNRSALDAFGGKLEYRINPDLSLQTGREPSTQARYCGSGPLLGTVGTPSQWSLSLLKSWRF
jgi:translocation and assembly module TamB